MKIGIVGAGNFGTAVAYLAGKKDNEIFVFDRDKEKVEDINKNQKNSKVYPEVDLNSRIKGVYNFDQSTLKDLDVLFVAVSSDSLRSVLEKLKSYLPKDLKNYCIINLSKGFEKGTLKRPAEVFESVLGKDFLYGSLSGPNFALEMVRDDLSASVVASKNKEVFERVLEGLSSPLFRPYFSEDIVGVELAGAAKNAIAIASGIHESLGFGKNSKAALITRGLAQTARLVEKFGGNRETVLGLSGVGDLVLTATSSMSRNYRLGELLGKGCTLEEARKKIRSTVEGVETVKNLQQICEKNNLDMSIVSSVHKILFEGVDPKKALFEIMSRPHKEESI
jgi:glycerol-3-phosphate dehydrogenase (NAD(P)+)